MKPEKMVEILERISAFVGDTPEDLAVTVAARTRDPFAVLVATLVSLRTKDEVTAIVAPRILALAPTPEKMLTVSEEEIAKALYPSSFYRIKSGHLREISQALIDRFNGQVPSNLDDLMSMTGIGRKSANLIITLAFNKPGICVDTHVDRLTNRIGFVQTNSPKQTEFRLRETLPKDWWIPINGLLIAFGRQHCTPVFPKCSTCPIRKDCKRIGVVKSR